MDSGCSNLLADGGVTNESKLRVGLNDDAKVMQFLNKQDHENSISVLY